VDYRKAGVDIDAVSDAMRSVKDRIRATFDDRVLRDVGHFGGLYAVPGDKRRALVASADGLGTKILIHSALGRYDRVGEDLVNQCVNDVAVLGAKPLFFLDYIAGASLPPGILEPLLTGFADACLRHGIALLGGETAEMPGMYEPGTYDVAGFIVGVVDRDRIIDGSEIRVGDRLLGFPSNGLHTNGYSLARKALLEERGFSLDDVPDELGATIGEALTATHTPYLDPIGKLASAGLVHGLAHITGGGIIDNVPRILPEGCDALVRKGSWPVPPLFPLIAECGSVREEEMFRVFNMGIGLVAAVPPERADEALALFSGEEGAPLPIGEITGGSGVVRFEQDGGG